MQWIAPDQDESIDPDPGVRAENDRQPVCAAGSAALAQEGGSGSVPEPLPPFRRFPVVLVATATADTAAEPAGVDTETTRVQTRAETGDGRHVGGDAVQA